MKVKRMKNNHQYIFLINIFLLPIIIFDQWGFNIITIVSVATWLINYKLYIDWIEWYYKL